MAYCPECGSEVAPNDIFCPYCGITLKPVAADQDVSVSNTIVAENPLKPDISNPPTPLANDNLAAEPVMEKSPESSQTVPVDNFSAGLSSAENPEINEPLPVSETGTISTDPEPVSPVFEEKNDEVLPENQFLAEENPVTTGIEPGLGDQPNEAGTVINDASLDDEIPIPSIIDQPVGEVTENPSDLNFATNSDEENFPAPDESPASNTPVVNEFEDVPPVFPKSEAVETPTDLTEEVDSSNEISQPPAFSGLSGSADPLEKPEENETVSAVEESENKNEDLVFEPRDIFSGNLPPDISPDSIKTITQSPENVAEFKEAISKQLERTPFEENIEPAPEMPAASVDAGLVEEEKSPIERPVAPFEAEVEEPISKFDSVRIMQDEEIEENKELPIPAVVNLGEDEPVEGRAFTSPNFGKGDTAGNKSAKLKPLEEGTVLNNRYEIVRKIGGGGMGAVYLANDKNLGGVLRAVKEMVQSYIESEQQDKAINDFKRESLLLTSLDHPSIPTIFDYFYDEKEARFYLVMKYISGGDLAGRLRAAPEGRIDEKSVTEWAIQIADVLDYLHDHEPPIVYRDLKPANVMIDGNSGRVMLIDFGIARWINKEEKGVTAVGTMGYAPPELFSGNVEPRSDIYSLGSTMFHLLTGADPQSNPLLIFDFQKNPRPRQINPQLSDQMERILMRAVEYNAEMRFTSAGEIRDDLKQHLTNLQAGKISFGVKSAPASLSLSEQFVFCGFCGKQIVATDVFCAFCGSQQPIAQQQTPAAAFAAVPTTAKLVILGTSEFDSSSFSLEKDENLIGRRDPMSNIFPEVDLSKFDPQTKISRRHARIWREGNAFMVEDLGSSNGTVLIRSMNNPTRLLPRQPSALTNGDQIKLGDTILQFIHA